MTDQFVSLSNTVPTAFSNPIAIGALRISNESPNDWISQTRSAVLRGCRVLLSGQVHEPNVIAKALLEIVQERATARFALMLHWTQAIENSPPAELQGHFDDVYVAIDRALSRDEVAQIDRKWSPKWLVLPSIGVAWKDWIAEVLFPKKTGNLLLLTPESSKGFLSADELRLSLDELAFQHPAIEFAPAPAEWFVPTEIGPWRARSRDVGTARTLGDSRSEGPYHFSAVVPFRWNGDHTVIETLLRCIDSIRQTFAGKETCEIILAIDSDVDTGPLLDKLDLKSRSDFAAIEVPRIKFDDHLSETRTEDWRAGFVRNVGASFATKSSVILFTDADAEIVDAVTLRTNVCRPEFELFQIIDDDQKVGFQSATSMFIAVRRTLFLKIGGFADAFSCYGAEDNFLVWQAVQRNARICPIPKSAIRHLRPPRESDDLFLKMMRLRKSADLMYRMTLDPLVHRHFFVSSGNLIWCRGLLKWLAEKSPTRFLLAPFVFFATLLETNRRAVYLRSFYDAYLMTFYFSRIERSGYYLRHQAARFFRAIYYGIRDLGYAIREIGYALREIGYAVREVASRKIVYWMGQIGRAIRGIGRGIREVYYAIREIGYALREIYYYVNRHLGHAFRELLRAMREVYYEIREVGYAIRDVYYVVRHKFYKAREKLFDFLAFVRHHVKKIVRTCYYKTRRGVDLIVLFLGGIYHRLKANAWLLKEPTAWFTMNAPSFYKWVWRPLLKARYFLQYHLFARWRNS